MVSYTKAHKTLIHIGMLPRQSSGRNATVLPKDELKAHVGIFYAFRPDNTQYASVFPAVFILFWF